MSMYWEYLIYLVYGRMLFCYHRLTYTQVNMKRHYHGAKPLGMNGF